MADFNLGIAKKRFRGCDFIECSRCHKKAAYVSDEEAPVPFICMSCGGPTPLAPTTRFQHRSIPSDAGIGKILHPEDRHILNEPL